MTDIKATVAAIIDKKAASPFLFVGSGFARRYLGLEDWEGLLRRFCSEILDFEYYLASANGDLPRAASLISRDFHEQWWKSERYKISRDQFKSLIKDSSAALKVEICKYLSSIGVSGIDTNELQNELKILRGLNVDGIITTNWDLLLEELFPEYRVFIGQDQLLFSNPQAIAEIYKIHGCSTQPNSLILTEEDYNQFHEKNPYLAAKLITLFIEHPIIFIGYSLADKHIQSMLFSIAACLDEANLKKFSDNLIFVRRAKGAGDSIRSFTLTHSGRSVNAVVLQTDDFSKVYDAIDEKKRKIPTRILRYCKEQMYELVKSSEPTERLAVMDIDALEASDDVEFVVGIGVAHAQSKEKALVEEESAKILSENGYKGVTASELLEDFLKEQSAFDPILLLNVGFSMFARTNETFIPVFRYLRDAGIKSRKELAASQFDGAKKIVERIKSRGYQVKSHKTQFERTWKDSTTSEIIAGVEAEKVALFVPFQRPADVDLNALKEFLAAHAVSEFRDPYSSYFKKLCCFYDRLAFGFDP